MKLSKITLAALFAGTVFLLACKKNLITSYVDATSITSEDAQLKINFNSLYAANPLVYFRVNGAKVSGSMNARSPFPGGGFNTGGDARADYLVLKPGSQKVDVILPKKVASPVEDSLILFTTTITLEAGKYYTLHTTDTAANTTSVLTTEDTNRPDSAFSKLRFINLMPNVPAVDLYYGTTLVASNIPYKGASPYFTVAATSALAWATRPAGALATSTALATYTSATTTANRRISTAFAIGYNLATDAVRKPYISFLLTN
jgi:hypothetical protein